MTPPSALPSPAPLSGSPLLTAVAQRFNREYQRDAFLLPPEVEDMEVAQQWRSGQLQAHLVSPFWELAQPRKNQHCLDLGCGISFLVYPWRDWEAYFHGQEISTFARDILTARAPQLNSKLFKGVTLKPAHNLEDHETAFYDLAIATGFSCYYPLAYWQQVLTQVKRVLKPGQPFIFDVVRSTGDLPENWAILETYLGAEVFSEPLSAWNQLIADQGAKILQQSSGELFHLYKIAWGIPGKGDRKKAQKP